MHAPTLSRAALNATTAGPISLAPAPAAALNRSTRCADTAFAALHAIVDGMRGDPAGMFAVSELVMTAVILTIAEPGCEAVTCARLVEGVQELVAKRTGAR